MQLNEVIKRDTLSKVLRQSLVIDFWVYPEPLIQKVKITCDTLASIKREIPFRVEFLFVYSRQIAARHFEVRTREVFFTLVQCNMPHPTNLKHFFVSPYSNIDLNELSSIVPETKSACLLGISLNYCPMNVMKEEAMRHTHLNPQINKKC